MPRLKMSYWVRFFFCLLASCALIYFVTRRPIDIKNFDETLEVIEDPIQKDSQHLVQNCRALNYMEHDVPIYMITPTYRRAEQLPEITRTAQTLLHVPNIFWIVVEDAQAASPEILEYLTQSGIRYVYLTAQMPKKFLKAKNKPRGVANRNKGLDWVRQNAKNGVVYFGDDDNTYDLRIFEEIRSTKGVSMFPVGLVTEFLLSSPVLKNGKVVGFYDGWIGNRKFPVDMAGFAINVQTLLKNPKAVMPYKVGYEETGILEAINLKIEDIEPKAENCSKIWVWHTQTKKNPVVNERRATKELKEKIKGSNIENLKKLLWTGK